jgi:hypothetical protein
MDRQTDVTSMFRKNFDWVTLRYGEVCDTSSVANVIRAMESKVMKCPGNIADL